MALKFSTEIRRRLAVDGSLKDILDGGLVRIYSGPVPVNSDGALTGDNIVLVEVDASGSLLVFEGAAPNGTLMKSLDQEWAANVQASGTPTFFRYLKPSDTGTATAGEVRVQGTAGGPAADMTITNAVLTEGTPHRIDYFAITIPESG